MTDAEIATTIPAKSPRKPRPSEIAAKAAKAAKTVKKAKPVVKTKPKKTNGAAKKAVGRPFMYPDQTLVRMPEGTLKRVHAACKADEGQGDFMRTAVMTELKRRRK
jgi:hypothetical protein